MEKYSFLIVDDSEDDRYLLRRNLQEVNIEEHIFEAKDGLDALEFFTNADPKSTPHFPPQIVFLDVNMPGMDGFEFLERFNDLRVQNDLSATVIIMFSSSALPQDKDRALQYDFVRGYMVKSDWVPEKLDEAIQKFQNKKPQLN